MKLDENSVGVLLNTLEALYDHYKDLDDDYFKGKAAAFHFALETVEEMFDVQKSQPED